MRFKKISIFLFYSIFSLVILADDEPHKQDRALEWEKAAQNREWAAVIQESQADISLQQAQELRKKEYLYNTERKVNLNRAGDLENRAGFLIGAAFGNYERARSNWGKAAREFKKERKDKQETNSYFLADTAKKNALRMCRKAAKAYELAANAYGDDNAEQPNKESAAREKAAGWRERLAGMK